MVDGEPNPHVWLDPSLVADDYIPEIVAALGQVDPAGASTYAANGDAYATSVRSMDAANKERIATIPAADRKLVTSHDAFPYFARHYGFDLIGVILPNVGQEPSPADLAALVETVKSARVSTLYTDSVGPVPNDTYLSMMRWDVDRIVEALS
jgi:ABC-type Zn uptake system ZnuABC Zn-binding protein ZnuA